MEKYILVFGTIFAAFLAGTFSYFNLINSKEQKVSEFRQAWIDAFRCELATLVSSVFFIAYYQSITKTHSASDIEASHKNYVSACAGLLTRINAQDPDIATNHINTVFLERLDELQTAFNKQDYVQVKVLANFLVDSSKPLLKAEWNRVKRGEKAYRRTKFFAGALCLFGLLTSVLFLNQFLTMS
ncbi:hypothetical protein M0C34_00315 [Agarivorans sp. TSD2052]|uniref:hypothetical protein n=1 Tax=Agarivorans sp. TSD2052 TaxID=2937286 RepID=UPI00200E0645|nr:hypothetical protein [Agarivorans sp. TSD2052]UPW18752.1 hypothetical protein M0C34_00315 [Agarivorans sp. TSD2052]